MTPRAHRLTKQEIFEVWKKHRSVADSHFRVLLQYQNHGQFKWQTKVEVKAHKKSAYRHRSRRLVDEVVKAFAKRYQGQGINLLILVKKDLHEHKLGEVQQKLQSLLERMILS